MTRPHPRDKRHRRAILRAIRCANAYSDTNCYLDAYANADTRGYSNRYIDANSHSISHGIADADADPDAMHGQMYTDTETASYSGTAPLTFTVSWPSPSLSRTRER